MASGIDSGDDHLLLVEQLRRLPASRRREHLVRVLREQIAARLLLDVADIDGRAPLMALGMSSLQVMELNLMLEQQLARPLSSSLPFDYPTLGELVPKLLELVGLEEPSEVASARPARPASSRNGDVAAELAAELAELRAGR